MWYRTENTVRVCVAVVGILGAIFAPWWVPLICMTLLSLRYAAWEVPFTGLLMDLLWLPSSGHFALPLFTLFGIGIVWLAIPLRRQLLL